jgi:hypothetical protein
MMEVLRFANASARSQPRFHHPAFARFAKAGLLHASPPPSALIITNKERD